jgi:hypothetical protein
MIEFIYKYDSVVDRVFLGGWANSLGVRYGKLKRCGKNTLKKAYTIRVYQIAILAIPVWKTPYVHTRVVYVYIGTIIYIYYYII